jgi:hypothetical protein
MRGTFDEGNPCESSRYGGLQTKRFVDDSVKEGDGRGLRVVEIRITTRKNFVEDTLELFVDAGIGKEEVEGVCKGRSCGVADTCKLLEAQAGREMNLPAIIIRRESSFTAVSGSFMLSVRIQVITSFGLLS